METKDLSCISAESVSNSRKNVIQSEVAAVRTIAHDRCVSEITEPPNESFEEIEGLFAELCSLNSQSDAVISKHVRDRDDKISNANQSVIVTDHFTDDVVQQMLNNDTLRKVRTISTTEMKQCCKSTFESLAVEDAGRLCRETLQCHEAWKKARELRISGSRIYGIYTYTRNALPDWEQKSKNFFWPTEFTNKFVRHGIAHEQLARETYENERNVNVVQCGFIVHPNHRWIGYSPDGLIVRSRIAEKLIEIKCVYNGKYKPIAECLSSCKFLDKDGGLKKRHTYYGQIQLGMLLCNVEACDFIVFASFDKSAHIISVPFDEKFALDMFIAVQQAYVKEMLHYICLHKKE